MELNQKEDFLKIYREILEYKGNFESTVLNDFFKYRIDLEPSEYDSYSEISEPHYSSAYCDFKNFKEFFLDISRKVYERINLWLEVLPIEEQKKEAGSLIIKIQFYKTLTDSYIIRSYEYTGEQILEHKWRLNNRFPIVKNSLEVIEKRIGKKYLLTEYEHTTEVKSIGAETDTPLPDINQRINKFNSMPIETVRKHFSKLTINRSKKGDIPHLTEKQFEQFISSAFLNSQNSPQKKIQINFSSGEKGFIRYLFYQFYELSKKDYESTDHVKDKYVRLLTDNFEGFSYKSIFDNFNKK